MGHLKGILWLLAEDMATNTDQLLQWVHGLHPGNFRVPLKEVSQDYADQSVQGLAQELVDPVHSENLLGPITKGPWPLLITGSVEWCQANEPPLLGQTQMSHSAGPQADVQLI